MIVAASISELIPKAFKWCCMAANCDPIGRKRSVESYVLVSTDVRGCIEVYNLIQQVLRVSTQCTDFERESGPSLVTIYLQSDWDVRLQTGKPPNQIKPCTYTHRKGGLPLLEAQFRNGKLTVDQTKYDVISSIELDILSQLSDILRSSPPDGKYREIKERLISLYADSEIQKTQRLLSESELRGKNPSQLLCKMPNFAGDKLADSFLRTLWLQRLLVNMRSITAVSGEHLTKVVMVDDKIWELNTITISNCCYFIRNFKYGTD
ncbi:transposon Ty3-G Gag-Pol polyprotein [Nephila pilipes]|uniref:Transposon Ty3-G Gag-Pol polyprotein n=1 Tax=Nephila pilipes TaxID=299642 RepID=A0A8X6IDN8_NEPPI|nr:transposon Ty3-G Gag-Pol polyprotein [Nephila pilipes]